jgi:hypothetical protein
MVALHTSVDHVGACTGTSAVIVTVRCRSRAASRKTGQTPGRASLRDSGENLLDIVLLDVLNLNILISLIRNEGAKSRYEEKNLHWGCREVLPPLRRKGWRQNRRQRRR